MQIMEQIKVLCIKNDLSMSELARRLGVTPQAFSQKLKRGSFSLNDLEDIAVVTGCKVECNLILISGEKISLMQ